MYMPYLTSLGLTYAHTTNYTAIQHPSLPNYLAVTSGSTQAAADDCGTNTTKCATAADNIFHQMELSGQGWQEWAESMPSNCATADKQPYVVHHAPPPYYTDLTTCAINDFPLNVNAVPTITAATRSSRRITTTTPTARRVRPGTPPRPTRGSRF